MKIKLIASLLILSGTSFAQTQPVSLPNPVLMYENTVNLNVNLTPSTVKMSIADYSSPTLKILVPELATLTFLDHRNSGEGAPCLGAVDDRFTVDDLLQNRPGVEKISLKISVSKAFDNVTDPATKDFDSKRCEVFLIETISSTIRGITFFHQRDKSLGTRDIEDCK